MSVIPIIAACRVCGCSQNRACGQHSEGEACSWVEPNLCDNCYWTARALRAWIESAVTPNTAALIRETATCDPALDERMDAVAQLQEAQLEHYNEVEFSGNLDEYRFRLNPGAFPGAFPDGGKR